MHVYPFTYHRYHFYDLIQLFICSEINNKKLIIISERNIIFYYFTLKYTYFKNFVLDNNNPLL